MKSEININPEQLTVISAGSRDQCSNKCQVSVKCRGSEACVCCTLL